jgi:ParB family transcriptional regulator, chromosome partitioning protein
MSKHQKKTNADVHRILIDDIVVREGRRAIDLEAVAAIADSMAEIGQRMPVTVRARKGRDSAEKVPVLVAGQHRLEAAKMLGWNRISAVYLDGDKTDARLWEIAENLHRSELSALERAEFVCEWADLVDARREDGHLAQPGGRQPSDKGISKAARALNVSREKMRRSKVIAGISAEAKAKAKELGLDDHQAALLKVAKEPTIDKQIAKVMELAPKKQEKQSQGDGASAEEHARDKRAYAALRSAWKRARKFQRAWADATMAARRRFTGKYLGCSDGFAEATMSLTRHA